MTCSQKSEVVKWLENNNIMHFSGVMSTVAHCWPTQIHKNHGHTMIHLS